MLRLFVRRGFFDEQLTYGSDKADGPTAGTAALDPLEFLTRFSAEP